MVVNKKTDRKNITNYDDLDCPLSKALMRDSINQATLNVIDELQVLESVSSTNDILLNTQPLPQGRFNVCIANQQTAGRGRNGKSWQSPPDANVYISVGAVLSIDLLEKLSGLSLACGVALSRLLRAMKIKAGIKWPNDILIDDKKLAGILVETRLQSKQVYVVVGVGFNIKVPMQAATKIDQPWIDLGALLTDNVLPLNRNELAAKLLMTLIKTLQQFAVSGFDSFAADWQRFEVLTGRNVVIKSGTKETNGRVLGFNEDHSLKIEIDQQEKNFYAADIKLKVVENASD